MRKSIKGNSEIAACIKRRRNELNLTIEEAAVKAGMGTKTWIRYESGESIRKDKYKGVCNALNWRNLPGKGDSEGNNALNLDEYVNHEAWSSYLVDKFGKLAAVSFAVGSDFLGDYLQDDMNALSSKPRGTHLGEIDVSWIVSSLPSQFLMRYDYEFLYALGDTVKSLRARARGGHPMIAHSVIEELALYLIVREFRVYTESMDIDMEQYAEEDCNDWDQWIFDIFDDDDVIVFLYGNFNLTVEHNYHFEHWMERQFYNNGNFSDE